VALIDFEVVDAQGRRCPTDEARVDFAVTGPVVWRGGFNAAKLNTTNNLYLDTGVRHQPRGRPLDAQRRAHHVTATREGLTPGTVTIEAKPVKIVGGLEFCAAPDAARSRPRRAGQSSRRHAAKPVVPPFKRCAPPGASK